MLCKVIVKLAGKASRSGELYIDNEKFDKAMSLQLTITYMSFACGL